MKGGTFQDVGSFSKSIQLRDGLAVPGMLFRLVYVADDTFQGSHFYFFLLLLVLACLDGKLLPRSATKADQSTSMAQSIREKTVLQCPRGSLQHTQQGEHRQHGESSGAWY